MVCVYGGGCRLRAGESSRCEDPAPTGGMAGRALRGMLHRPLFTPMRGSTGTADGGVTTRRAASLRPPRNGRIDLNLRIPKGEPRQKERKGAIFLERFSLLARKSFSIKKFHISKTIATRRAASLEKP